MREAPSQLLPSRPPALRPPHASLPQAAGTRVSRPSLSWEQPSLPFIVLVADPPGFSCEAIPSGEPSGTYIPRTVACRFAHLPRRLCSQACLPVAPGGSRLSGHAESGLSPHAGCQAEGQTPSCLEHPAPPPPHESEGAWRGRVKQDPAASRTFSRGPISRKRHSSHSEWQGTSGRGPSASAGFASPPPPRAIGFCAPLASLLKIGAPTSSPRKARVGGPREFCRQRRGRRGLRLRCAAESESGVGGLPPAGMDWGGTSSRGQETQGDCAENQTWNKNQVVPPPTLLLQRGGELAGREETLGFLERLILDLLVPA